MTPRVFALVAAVLWAAVLLISTTQGDVLQVTLFAVSVAASYVLALNLAYRAITLGLIPPKN